MGGEDEEEITPTPKKLMATKTGWRTDKLSQCIKSSFTHFLNTLPENFRKYLYPFLKFCKFVTCDWSQNTQHKSAKIIVCLFAIRLFSVNYFRWNFAKYFEKYFHRMKSLWCQNDVITSSILHYNILLKNVNVSTISGLVVYKT